MAIDVQCPGCQRNLKVKDELAGRRLKCPECGAVFTVPTLEPTPTAPAIPIPVLAASAAAEEGYQLAPESEPVARAVSPAQPQVTTEKPKAPAAATPEPIHFVCPSCGKAIHAPPGAAGKQAHCPACKKPVAVPAVLSAKETAKPGASSYLGPPEPLGSIRKADQSGEVSTEACWRVQLKREVVRGTQLCRGVCDLLPLGSGIVGRISVLLIASGLLFVAVLIVASLLKAEMLAGLTAAALIAAGLFLPGAILVSFPSDEALTALREQLDVRLAEAQATRQSRKAAAAQEEVLPSLAKTARQHRKKEPPSWETKRRQQGLLWGGLWLILFSGAIVAGLSASIVSHELTRDICLGVAVTAGAGAFLSIPAILSAVLHALHDSIPQTWIAVIRWIIRLAALAVAVEAAALLVQYESAGMRFLILLVASFLVWWLLSPVHHVFGEFLETATMDTTLTPASIPGRHPVVKRVLVRVGIGMHATGMVISSIFCALFGLVVLGAGLGLAYGLYAIGHSLEPTHVYTSGPQIGEKVNIWAPVFYVLAGVVAVAAVGLGGSVFFYVVNAWRENVDAWREDLEKQKEKQALSEKGCS